MEGCETVEDAEPRAAENGESGRVPNSTRARKPMIRMKTCWPPEVESKIGHAERGCQVDTQTVEFQSATVFPEVGEDGAYPDCSRGSGVSREKRE